MKHTIGVIFVIAVGTLVAWALLGRGFDSLLLDRAADEAA